MADARIISPFALLAEAPAEEILILTYVANLGFFERFALAESRRSGARVTVVYDAQADTSDPLAVRFAGVSYLPGAALCNSGGAFHPKLIVAVSEENARVLIGSGNMTPGGWHHNAELWTLLRGDQTQAPGTFRDLSEWLSGLSAQVVFSDGVERALWRVAALLASFPQTEPGPILITSLTRPIIDQLPADESVDELRVSAPFLDSDAEGLTRVHQRFNQAALHLALQSAEAMFDGAGLVAALDQLGGHAFEIDDPALRYHHAKLVEWKRGTALSALTGSPNLTRRALLYGMPSGGNCELALVADIETSLMPPVAEPIERDRLLARHFDLQERDSTGMILLSAVLNADGTTVVTTGRPITEPTTLERLAESQWQHLRDVERHSDRFLIHGILAAGTPIRLQTASGQNSNIIYVVNLERATRRLQQGAPSRPPPNPDDLFDIAVVEAILADVTELKSHIAAPSAGGTSDSDTSPPLTPKPHSWRELLEDRSQRRGDPLMAFALGLPGLTAPTAHRVEVFDDDTANDLDASEQEQAMVEVDAVEQTNRRISRSTTIRRRYLRALQRISSIAPELAEVDRLLALRILLRAIALTALWETDEHWPPLVARATLAVATAEEVYPEMRAAQASLAVTATTLLRSAVRLSTASTARTSYEQVASAVRPMVEDVDGGLVAIYVSTLWPRGVTGVPQITPESVQALVDQLERHDPIDAAIATLDQELGVTARRHGVAIEVEDELEGDGRRRLMRVVSLARGAPIVAAYGTGPRGGVLVVWEPPILIVLRDGAQPYGDRYHTFSPEDLVGSEGEIPGRREELRDPQSYSEAAGRTLRDAGIDPSDPFGGLP